MRVLVGADARTVEGRPLGRDDAWLNRELDFLWNGFFYDVAKTNIIEINFAGFWKSRLGLISLSHSRMKSFIKINGYLRSWEIPDYVVRAVVAHELVHYAHGFGSPLMRKYRYPHRGGVVSRELSARGLGVENKRANKWIRQYWHNLVLRLDADGDWAKYRDSALLVDQEVVEGVKIAN